MKHLLKYFLVGFGILAGVFAFIGVITGIVMAIGYVIDSHPLISKYLWGSLAVAAVIVFLTFYGWLICEQ